jgi:O-antigen/teichoic acid export membrane protein
MAATVNIAGNLALAPYYGTSSAAALTLVGYLIWLGGVMLVEHAARRLPAREAFAYQAHVPPMAYGD